MSETSTRVVILGDEASGADGRMPGTPLPDFRLTHAENSWDYVPDLDEAGNALATGRWLPDLSREYYSPGVNGCGHGREGRAIARTKWLNDDKKEVPLDSPVLVTNDARDGYDRSRGYLNAWDSTSKTEKGEIVKTHGDVWSNPEPKRLDRGKFTTEWNRNYDRDGYDATRGLWIDLGLVYAPTAARVSARVEAQRKRLERNAKHAGSSNSVNASRYERELAIYNGMLAATPVTRGRRGTAITADPDAD